MKYTLSSDVTLNSWTPVALSNVTFEGNNHTISGIYMDIDSTKAFAYGMFGKTAGTIKNLSLKNSYISCQGKIFLARLLTTNRKHAILYTWLALNEREC